MFLHLSVSHSVHGVCVYPSMHWADIPPQTYSSMHWGRHPPLGRHIPACTGADTPPACRHIPAYTGADTSPRADISQHALGQTSPWADISQHAHGQTSPWADISQHALGQTHPLGRHIPACTGPDTLPYPRRPLQRTVRILLECILVTKCILQLIWKHLIFTWIQDVCPDVTRVFYAADS